MITFLYGTYGSGKTTAVLESIAKDVQNGIHTFFIVPEQETVQAEHTILQFLPPSAQLHIEVLNFSRLYNRACREYGGISYRYITAPIRHLLMWQNLNELAPLLEEYGEVAGKDTSLGEIMLSALNECKACGIAPEQLESAAKQLKQDDPLAKRLRDLSLIFSSFDRLVSENYSDSSDDLARLYDILKKEDFFQGCHVYLDSFTSFTAVEHCIIERIFAQAAQVTVTIPLPHPECNEISTAGIRESLKRIIQSAERHGGYTNKILHGNRRSQSAALAYLSENLWRMDVTNGCGIAYSDGSIHLEICDTPYSEAEAASAHILELLRSGERCRDILILMRNPEQYKGIIEPALEKNKIPYFFSNKTDLCSLPPVKLLLSALRIKQYHWRKEDILSHIKTGMYDFSERSCDLFEEYVSTWNIQGTRFTEGRWTMNPDGFTDSISERGQEILSAANEIQQQLIARLESFFILLEAAQTVPDLCRAVYRYVQEIHLEDRLAQLAEKELKRGNRKEAKEWLSLYGILLNTLADIASAMPDQAANTEEFSIMLRTVFAQTEIGTIPTSMDEVVIGSAAMLRASNPKYVLILGLCEGEFPANVNEAGIFSTGDRSALEELGIKLSSDIDIRSSDELMYVQRAFAAASHGLYLFTSTSEMNGKSRSPSLPFRRVSALFPELQPHRFCGSDLRYLVGTPYSAAMHLRTLDGTAEGVSLQKALKDHFPNIKEDAFAFISDPQCSISPELVDTVMGKNLRFSSTRFETYTTCPFNYYCTYVLGLREKKQASFRASNIGSFIHYILEQLLKSAIQENENGAFPDDETLIQMTEKKVAEYVDRICPDELIRSKKLRHLYVRLKRLALVMVRNIVEEFSHSEFRPAFFELPTNGKDNNPLPMQFVLSDQSTVSFSGVIDRVDVLKKNGEVFIRIIDYKTGTKTFSFEDVQHGLNIQMLLYLFTLCRNADTKFCKALGLEDGQTPTPAGIVYLSANVPVLQIEDYDSEEAVLNQAADSLKRSGLLLNEEEILRAMNSELSPKFLAGIKQNKDGILTGSALTDRQVFGEIYDQLANVIETITQKLRSGVAHATPFSYSNQDPCAYCNMKPICRIIKQ